MRARGLLHLYSYTYIVVHEGNGGGGRDDDGGEGSMVLVNVGGLVLVQREMAGLV